MKFRIETEREEDGRWLAEVTDLLGVLAYAATAAEAQAKMHLALRLFAEWFERGEAGPELLSISFQAR